ncbi:MAG: hypothetical protein M1818_008032 [Claussenomyces sp. TS43310]|nr:MAG: hypothetical protein M1818_008032 [Claussenomyces sp. TS43310]
MTSPYWGSLDPPAGIRQTAETQPARRDEMAGDRGTNARQQSTSYPLQPTQSQSRQPNRVSIQSQASSQSPFVSPTASSFQGEGLAPRPPTFPYATTEGYKTDHLEKRRRRASRDPDLYYNEDEPTGPPPAVPEPPAQAPPINFRQFQARGRVTAPDEVPVSSERAKRPDNLDAMAQEPKAKPYQDQVPGRAGPIYGNNGRRSGAEPEFREPVDTLRKGSAVETEAQRRREWAPDRSPLQKLELTLDSITKEEKRARVQEAEQLAREKQAGRGGEKVNPNSVRFRNRPLTKGAEIKTPTDVQPFADVAPGRTTSHGQNDAPYPNKMAEGEPVVPIEAAPGRPRVDSSTIQKEKSPQISERQRQNSSVPQRQNSRRDAGTTPAEVAAGGAIVAAADGSGLKRNTSNKLKKEPPGDPWYNQRIEAERKYQAITPRRASVDERPQHIQNAGQPDFGSRVPTKGGLAQQGGANTNRQMASTSSARNEPDSPDALEEPPIRRGSSRKVAQLTGQPMDIKQSRSPVLSQQQQLYADRLDRSEELGPLQGLHQTGAVDGAQIKTVNGIKYAVAPGIAEGDYGQDRAAMGSDGHHHFENILHGHSRRSQYRPGDGIYAPSKSLDEWKKGGVARLSGALLDLSPDPLKQTEAEKNKAWWEAGNKGRRRSISTKQTSIPSFDGGADMNGTVVPQFSNSLSSSNRATSPFLETSTWSQKPERVFPRARQYIGYQGTSKSNSKVQRRNKSWMIHILPWPVSDPEFRMSPQTSSTTFSSPYLFDCLEVSHHNIFHPFHVCYSVNARLTASMRTIRVRASTDPTQFKPPLFLKCGPLLRYCGLQTRATAHRPSASHASQTREIWRGSVMIVTSDQFSSYELGPILRLFAQPVDLRPPPPAHVDGGADQLAPEYVDPIAGLPKIGRNGNTLYVRPVEELEEGKDVSKDEGSDGLFERQRSSSTQGTGPTMSSAGSHLNTNSDGERLGKYAEVKGVRLHTERGFTFWRFSIEVELGARQQRIAYRINRGPATGFWVPAKGQSMNIMFHSCNGFSLSVNPDQFSGPDPMWRDVLNTHQTQPFHVMIGGGDQIYNDAVMKDTKLFEEWLAIKNPLHKHNAPFTQSMQDEIEEFYLNRYSMWFSQGLFGLANSQIPMVNIYDDHDIIDGFGSYPHHFMDSPVFSGLGEIAFKYYMLFQHQTVVAEGEDTEPSWLIGTQPGPYIKQLSRSVFLSMGGGIKFLGLDCRTERTREEVLSLETLDKVFDRLHGEIIKGETKHLIILLGVPIAYPRLVWLENILTSRLLDPVKAMSKAGIFSKLINQFDGGVEILDDLDDHWTAKNHKRERLHLIQDLQDVAADKSVRVTILGGDVHLAAVGQFYSNPKHALPKDRDHRYMPNVISSAIVNTPPPDMMADIINKRNKVHHVDSDTEEDMIPMFTQDVNGTKRNNKHLLPRRNWCSIRAYDPELTPPPTPVDEASPDPPAKEGLLRRFSSRRGPSYRADAGPPPTRGLMRNLSFGGRRQSMDVERPRANQPRKRSLSMSRKFMPGGLFHRNSKRRPDDGGINGYGAESDDDIGPDDYDNTGPRLRGGAGDPSYFPEYDSEEPPVRTRSRITRNGVPKILHDNTVNVDHDHSPRGAPSQPAHGLGRQDDQPDARAVEEGLAAAGRRPFHRTPTGMSAKQMKALGDHEINLEGGLEISINVEVSQKDPAGITVPYRLLVPALFYEDEGYGGAMEREKGRRGTVGSSMKRLMSFRGGRKRTDGAVDVDEGEMMTGGRDLGVQNGNGRRPPSVDEASHDRSRPPVTQANLGGDSGGSMKRSASLKRWIGIA